jgi:hypothetical protein
MSSMDIACKVPINSETYRSTTASADGDQRGKRRHLWQPDAAHAHPRILSKVKLVRGWGVRPLLRWSKRAGKSPPLSFGKFTFGLKSPRLAANISTNPVSDLQGGRLLPRS